jgi:pimeloyl-ACP methyl ester carboxylesterase
MISTAAIIGMLLASPVEHLPARFWQVTPELRESALPPQRAKDRAVVLVHGLVPQLVRSERARRPQPKSWQEPGSDMVRALEPDFDIFAFSYAQTLPIDLVCRCGGLRSGVARLKTAGYRDIVLVGHSAGAVIVRQFAEHHPRSGVTKVIAVGGPHSGSPLALVPDRVVPPVQKPFIKSLSPEVRVARGARCPDLCPELEFCCVVGKLPRLSGDWIVPAASQWPPELRRQGIPAVVVPLGHFELVRSAHGARVVSELAREKLTRWTPAEVEQFERIIGER